MAAEASWTETICFSSAVIWDPQWHSRSSIRLSPFFGLLGNTTEIKLQARNLRTPYSQPHCKQTLTTGSLSFTVAPYLYYQSVVAVFPVAVLTIALPPELESRQSVLVRKSSKASASRNRKLDKLLSSKLLATDIAFFAWQNNQHSSPLINCGETSNDRTRKQPRQVRLMETFCRLGESISSFPVGLGSW